MLFVADDGGGVEVFRAGQREPPGIGVWDFSAVEKDIFRRVQGKVMFGKRGGVAVRVEVEGRCRTDCPRGHDRGR